MNSFKIFERLTFEENGKVGVVGMNAQNEEEKLLQCVHRLANYERRQQAGLLLELPSRQDEIIHAVNIALKIKLYDWQIAYIFGASEYLMPGRVTGGTTAYMLRLLLSKGQPIHLYKPEVLREICDEDHGSSYNAWFKSNLRDMYYELSNPGLRLTLRKIYFSHSDWVHEQDRKISCGAPAPMYAIPTPPPSNNTNYSTSHQKALEDLIKLMDGDEK